jgi:hypothetical protein
MRKNLLKILDKAAIVIAYEKIFIKVPEFTKELLEIYVKASLYGCYTYSPNQGMKAL